MLVCCCFERNLDGLGFRMKKVLVIFGPNFWTPATVRAAAIRQEIAPQTISTKDVYQSKHIVAAQIGEARRARRRPAKQILIQLTILRSTVWIIIINTHAKPLKSEHWKGPVDTIRILWGKYYIQAGSQKGLADPLFCFQIAHLAHLLPPHKRH